MSTLRWRVHRDGAPEAVVAFDYENGRKEAGFADLAELLPAGPTLLELEFGAVGDAGDRPLEPTALCRSVLAEVRELGRRVTAALGYCAGAGLACLLADLAAGSGAPDCRAVLFDPLRLGDAALARAYAAGVEGIRAGLDESDYRAALAAGDRVLPGGRLPAEQAHRLPDVIRELTENYAWAVRRSGERAELPDELRDEMAAVEADLVSHFGSYLRYLATVAAVDLGGSWRAGGQRPPVVFASRDHAVPAEFRPFLRRRFDVPQAALLSDDRVAAAVGELLTG